jgi:FixJ family two-component response regulator
VVEPAKAAEIAPIIVQAYELTDREQQITRLIARGAATADIAEALFLSSRGELVAKLFAEHYEPVHFGGEVVRTDLR